MDRIWFVFDNAEVTGPFTSEEIKARAEARTWNEGALIWWRGQKEWTSLERWISDLPQILEARRHAGTKIQWYVYHQAKRHGPMHQADLIRWVQAVPPHQLNDIRIWTDHSREWKSVFDFHEIALGLGMNARKTPRAGIFGFATLSETQLTYQLSAIGAGGFGIEGAKDLLQGQIFTITIKSPLLVNPIHATGEVRYVSSSGQAGFSFTQIGMEAISLIMDYVRQYRDTSHHITEAIEAEAKGRKPKLWYLARQGQQEGPYSHGDLIQMLQWMDDRSDVSLWTEGMQHWASLFEFNDILEQTGLSRRAGPRAPIQGEVEFTSPSSMKFAAVSISITGFGFHSDGSLQKGNEIVGTLTSHGISVPIPFQALIRYVDSNGYVGAEFQNLSGEFRKTIADYVQPFHSEQFTDETTQTTKAA